MAKNYKLWNVGEKVVITRTGPKNNDLGTEGVITCVRNSFCKILIDGKEQNHTYGQFKNAVTVAEITK